MKRDKIGGYLMVGLLGAEALLVLASWLLTAAMPDEFSRSLLSAEGIRWFMGHFALNMSSVWLVWLLLFSLAWGALRGSGVLRFQRSSYSQRLGMYWVIAELAVFVAMLLALTLPSHAILVNVMGGLFPSSFSAWLVPYVCFAVVVMSITYRSDERTAPNDRCHLSSADRWHPWGCALVSVLSASDAAHSVCVFPV